jgi:hypothetical protein
MSMISMRAYIDIIAETTKPDSHWRIVKLANKMAAGRQSIIGIAEFNGQFVLFHGMVGDKYVVSPPGDRDVAENSFDTAKGAGFQEISPGRYPVIRGGSLPDLSSFGRRRNADPLPKGSVAWRKA